MVIATIVLYIGLFLAVTALPAYVWRTLWKDTVLYGRTKTIVLFALFLIASYYFKGFFTNYESDLQILLFLQHAYMAFVFGGLVMFVARLITMFTPLRRLFYEKHELAHPQGEFCRFDVVYSKKAER